MPELPSPDPVQHRSLAGWYMIAALLLLTVFAWALFDEVIGLRPWKSYQARFKVEYAKYLRKQITQQRAQQQKIENSPEYLALAQKAAALKKQAQPEIEKINSQIAVLNAQFDAILHIHTTRQQYVASNIYIVEYTKSAKRKKELLTKLARYEKQISTIRMPEAGGKTRLVHYNYRQLMDAFNQNSDQKSALYEKEGNLMAPASDAEKKAKAYLADHLTGPNVTALQGLLAGNRRMSIRIRQFYNGKAGIVDRCESCHIGILQPIKLTKADMGGNLLFISHPDMELLKIHDPVIFGCSPCHAGNGMYAESVKAAHGFREDWTWPLFSKSDLDAGCQECHAKDMVVDHAPVLNEGKFLFEWRGCEGCHAHAGYDQSPGEIRTTQREITSLEKQRNQDALDVQRSNHLGDIAATNAEAQADYLHAQSLQVSMSKISMRIDHDTQDVHWLMMDEKMVGPDLKEIRAELNKRWIPVWLHNPHAFDPTTRMPNFPFRPGDVKAISAFLWQDAIHMQAPQQPPGDPVKGKQLFRTRGCMACHAVGYGKNAAGGWFGPNLTRVGEKMNYDYLVRWIHNPRQRLEPYCPALGRDLTPADYQKAGLPFVFGLHHDTFEGHALQVEQETVMPNLRLTLKSAQDIASYLITLKEKDPSSYSPAPYMSDPKLAAKGKKLLQFYGCSGCHEIAGFENAQKIGTELTAEGSKPLELFAFSRFLEDAERGRDGWAFTRASWFEHKLKDPEIFDQGMIRTAGEQLHMPNFHLKPEEINALTTFLLGSQTPRFPKNMMYDPSGPVKDIQQGWWIIKKYNCEGCHQFTLGQSTALMTLPWFQTPNGKGDLPPRLLTEGARVNPNWLANFLANPALSDTDVHRDGVRTYLPVRMPTFYLSPIEIRKLVRFFEAMSHQPMPYIPRPVKPLTPDQLAMGRALFVSPAAPCLKCHAIGVPAHDKFATAPNFLLARKRLKPDWVRHWIMNPALIDPGTAMPSGLFKEQDGLEVFSGPVPPALAHYKGDEVNLIVRYLFELTPEEQQRLIQMSGKMLMPAPATTSQLERPQSPAARSAAYVGTLVASH